MKKPIKPGAGSGGATTKQEEERLVAAFRAFLHTAVVAEQRGQSDRLATLPGPQMVDFCWAMADLPDNTLARELAGAVQAIVRQIEENVWKFRPPRPHEKPDDPTTAARRERIQEQLDLALAFVLRLPLRPLVRLRAEYTKSADLFLEAIWMEIGNGVDAARLIRRYQKLVPKDQDRGPDGALDSGGLPDILAWDAYQRVDELDRLADEFPEQVAMAARNMHAWPMLVHRHTDNRRRFSELAARLKLGTDYPLDASEGARFRPDTPMVRYLDPLIYSLHMLRCNCEGEQFESIEKENERVASCWWEWPNDRRDGEVLPVLRAARAMPPLTKATAHTWTEKILVPLILATDARDPAHCAEPVLQRIWRQKGVKSRGTFKSRLLAAVSATLRRLAREP